jgi:hypothetical protein
MMGGASDDDWHPHPEKDAIIVGTRTCSCPML